MRKNYSATPLIYVTEVDVCFSYFLNPEIDQGKLHKVHGRSVLHCWPLLPGVALRDPARWRVNTHHSRSGEKETQPLCKVAL